MMRITQNSCTTLLFCLLLCGSLRAQGFKNKATLAVVNKTGFYSIAVTPELSSYVKTDFSDLRVMDENEKQVQYIIRNPGSTTITDSLFYKPLNIISKEQGDSGRTIVVMENSAKEKISSIALLIANTSVSRMADISGSDDNNRWYSITEGTSLGRKFITDTDKYAETIYFPMVSYRYLRLVTYNGKNDPLNIISAGNYKSFEFKTISPYTKNPPGSFVQTDSSNGYSYVRVHTPAAYHTNEIVLDAAGPKFFKRDVEVIIPYGESAGFTISPGAFFTLDMPVFKSTDWLIKIYNGDNPPLKIKSISTFKEATNIIAWLDSGKAYHLEINNAAAIAPHYDLQNFRDSIPKNVTPISFSAIEPITPVSNHTKPGIFTQSWLWPVIMFILLVLVFFTWRLMKEVGTGKSNG